MAKRPLLPPTKKDTIGEATVLDWTTLNLEPNDISIPEDQSGIFDVSFFPTPWARVYAVDYAFQKISSPGDLSLSPEEKKMIVWTLDLLELVFLKNVYAVDLSFEGIPDLEDDNLFKIASILFWEYDNPIIIKEILPNNQFRILGATSPYTLVFPAFHLINDHYAVGLSRKLFNPDITHINLTDRPADFLAFLHYLQENIPIASASHFKTFLQKSFENQQAPPHFLTRCDDIHISINAQTAALQVGDQSGRLTLPCLKPEQFRLESDFTIVSNIKSITATPVLIAGKQLLNQPLFKNFPIQVPTDQKTLQEHKKKYEDKADTIIPGSVLRWKWLGVDDLFSDKLIKMPYKLDGDNFILGISEGNPNSVKDECLLPLTHQYFTYFEVDEAGNHPVANNYEIIYEYGKYTCTLKINLQGFLLPVSLEKIYREDLNNVKVLNGDGYFWFVSIYPDFVVSNYTASVADETLQVEDILGNIDYYIHQFAEPGIASYPFHLQLEFYKRSYSENTLLLPVSDTTRLYSQIQREKPATRNYTLKGHPDLIKYVFHFGSPTHVETGFLIPYYKRISYITNPQNDCTIAVDFGTSSTAAAYKFGNQDKPHEFTFNRVKQLSLVDLDIPYNLVYSKHVESPTARYFINNRLFSNPIRSLLSFSPQSSSLRLLESANIYLDRDELSEEGNNRIEREFKWKINNAAYEEYFRDWIIVYLSQYLTVIKYELLNLNIQPNFKRLKLKWFFPLAFNFDQLAVIGGLWKNEIAPTIFPYISCNDFGIDESIAPFYANLGVGNDSSVMNIDIGGGTTDICILKGNEQKLKLSLPFAARNITGDLHDDTRPTHVNKIIPDSIRVEHGAHESFIRYVTRKNSVATLFRNKEMAVIFFYYVVLQYVKLAVDASYPHEKDKIYPDSISFSGNGSRILMEVLRSENNEKVILLERGTHAMNDITRSIFNKQQVKITFSGNPKTATVFGGLLMKDIEMKKNSSHEILGENINGHGFDTVISAQSILGNIPLINKSYVLQQFFPECLQFVKTNHKSMVDLTSASQVSILIDYLQKQINDRDVHKLMTYMQSGLNFNGYTGKPINSSLLLYAMQGYLNELTREL